MADIVGMSVNSDTQSNGSQGADRDSSGGRGEMPERRPRTENKPERELRNSVYRIGYQEDAYAAPSKELSSAEESSYSYDYARGSSGAALGLGLLGAALLVLGTFLPLASVSSTLGTEYATVNYYGNGVGDGWFMLLFAAIGVGTLAAKRFNFVRGAGIAALGLILIDFVRLSSKLSEISNSYYKAGLSWGWLVLIAGAVLLLVAPSVGPKEY